MLSEVADPFDGIVDPYLALRLERYCDHCHGKISCIPAGFGDNGYCTGAGTASHSCSQEYHLGIASYGFHHIVDVFHGSLATDIGFASRTAAFGNGGSKLNLHGHLTSGKSLMVGVTDYKVYILDALFEHVIYRVVSTAAYSYNFNNG